VTDDGGIEVRFPIGHFYSPFPDTRVLSKPVVQSRVWPAEPHPTPGVDWHDSDQVELCRAFAEQSELVFASEPTDDPNEYAASSVIYPLLDALVLQAMLQHLRPKRVIEAGSGDSSLVTARVNREILGGELEFTCIEPYPRDFLVNGVPGISELRQEEIQDTPLELFDELGDGDVFFVDTSHTVKTGGDVTWIFHQIIPRLKPGVVVHIHDAFLPGDYPKQWVMEGWGWNESYLLQAFLAFNAVWQVTFGVQYMIQNHKELLHDAFEQLERVNLYAGGSLWMRRAGG
jgi:hypothetical protein